MTKISSTGNSVREQENFPDWDNISVEMNWCENTDAPQKI